MRAVYITTNGNMVECDLRSLGDMQTAVGGLIEPVTLAYEGVNFDMFVNEEGAILDLRLNEVAMQLVQLCAPGHQWSPQGDVFLIGAPDFDTGESTDLPQRVIDIVRHYSRKYR